MKGLEPMSPSPPSQQSSKSRGCSANSIVLRIFVLSIGWGMMGLIQMNLVAFRSLENSTEPAIEDFKINRIQQKPFGVGKRQRNETASRQTVAEFKRESQNSVPEIQAVDPPLHERVSDPVSQAWVVAMQEAEEMLSQKPTRTTKAATESNSISSLEAACLVPDKQKTKELVRKLLLEKKKNRNGSKENKHSGYQPPLPPPENRTFEEPLVPLPILNVGMPKLGSTSLHHYFRCKGLRSTHWNMGTEEFEGLCMRDAVRVGLPPLATCSNGTHAIMQLDVAFPMGSRHDAALIPFRSSANRDDCFFPQLSILEEFHAESPHATLVLTFRPMQDWTKSVTGWHSILERLSQCHLPNLPRGVPDVSAEPEPTLYNNVIKRTNHTESLERAMTQFFCSHVLHVRNFVKQYPTHNLIELDLYDEETPKILDQLFPTRVETSSQNNETSTDKIHSNDETKSATATDGYPSLEAASSSSCWGKHTGGFNKNYTDTERQRQAKRRKAMKKNLEETKAKAARAMEKE